MPRAGHTLRKAQEGPMPSHGAHLPALLKQEVKTTADLQAAWLTLRPCPTHILAPEATFSYCSHLCL